MKQTFITTIILLHCFHLSKAQIVKQTTYYGYSPTRIHEIYYVNLKTGLRHGKYTEYKDNFGGLAPDGLLSQGVYSEGKKTGKWLYYVPMAKDNPIRLVENYNSEGLLHGYYQSSDKEGSYHNGKREGTWLFYYANGLIQSKQKYKGGEVVDTTFLYEDSREEPRLRQIKVFDKQGNLLNTVEYRTAKSISDSTNQEYQKQEMLDREKRDQELRKTWEKEAAERAERKQKEKQDRILQEQKAKERQNMFQEVEASRQKIYALFIVYCKHISSYNEREFQERVGYYKDRKYYSNLINKQRANVNRAAMLLFEDSYFNQQDSLDIAERAKQLGDIEKILTWLNNNKTPKEMEKQLENVIDVNQVLQTMLAFCK